MKFNRLCCFGLATCLTAVQFSEKFLFEKELEANILPPLLSSEHPELFAQWTLATQECSSNEELLERANALITLYEAWNPRRCQASEGVFENPDIMSVFISHLPLECHGPFSQVSKSILDSIQKPIEAKYRKNGIMNWFSILQEAFKLSKACRSPLVCVMLKNWPKSEEPIISALLLKAKDLLQYAERSTIPYIPGHLKLWAALTNSSRTPFEALYYEEADVFKCYIIEKFSGSYLKKLLASGNQRAISNIMTMFQPLIDVEGTATPSMTWKRLDDKCNVILAIFYHQNTVNHAALITHLSTVLAQQMTQREWHKMVKVLEDSSLSTTDVLVIADGPISERFIFDYPSRALEIISAQGFCGEDIDLDLLRREKLKGPYSRKLLGRIGELNFFQIATITDIEDADIMEALVERPYFHFEKILYHAMVNERSLEFVEYLVNKYRPSLIKMFPKGYRIPDKYRELVFCNDYYETIYFWGLIQMKTIDCGELARSLGSMSLEHLRKLLGRCNNFRYDMNEIKFYAELVRLMRKDSMRVSVEWYFAMVCSRIQFEVALLSQSLETLKWLHEVTTNKRLENLICKAIWIKMGNC